MKKSAFSAGLLLCAGGKKKYIQEAIYAAKSFKRHNPSVPIALCSDQEVNSPVFDHVILETELDHPQKLKMHGMLHTPFDRTLYLDSDTKTTASLGELFALLEFYDIGLTHRVKCTWPPNSTPTFVDYIDHDCLQGGFLLFRKSNSALRFIQKWFDGFNQTPGDKIQPGTPFGDQVVLNAVFAEDRNKQDLNYVYLPNYIYNARPWMWNQLKADGIWSQTKILHAHGLNTPAHIKFIRKIKHRLGLQ